MTPRLITESLTARPGFTVGRLGLDLLPRDVVARLGPAIPGRPAHRRGPRPDPPRIRPGRSRPGVTARGLRHTRQVCDLRPVGWTAWVARLLARPAHVRLLPGWAGVRPVCRLFRGRRGSGRPRTRTHRRSRSRPGGRA